MNRLISLVIFAVIIVVPQSAAAQFVCQGQNLSTDKIADIVAKVEAGYRELKGLSAEFEQDSLFLGFSERIRSTGTVLFKKPGMMDWNYQSPEKQRFIADGKNLWFYQPKWNQVTVGKFQQSFQSGLPVSFLLGLGSLSQDFSVKRACKGTLGVVLELTPKVTDPSLQVFKLLVDQKLNVPRGAHVVDVGGNETQIVFSNIETDVEVDDKQFQFTIPKGVDVIDQRGIKQAESK